MMWPVVEQPPLKFPESAYWTLPSMTMYALPSSL